VNWDFLYSSWWNILIMVSAVVSSVVVFIGVVHGFTINIKKLNDIKARENYPQKQKKLIAEFQEQDRRDRERQAKPQLPAPPMPPPIVPPEKM
jgi:Na+/H+ antiporter NhaB